jgi:uncharacterized protein YbjT (DUF2867 family)
MDDQQPMRILVAGATGNLGKALIPVLGERGTEVVALVRPGSQSRLLSFENHITETVTAEITEPDIAASAFNGVHTVISSVGITRQRDGLTYDQVDYGGNLNLLQAAERAAVQRFIYVSVVGADRDVDVPVIQAKRRFEEALIESTLKWQIVRPSGFFTDMTDVWKMALRGTVHLIGDGQNKISPIDPVDLAEAIADLLEAEPGQILSIGGPADFTWNEIAELASQVAGKNCTIRHWPKLLLRAALTITRVISRPTYGTLSFLGHVMTNDTTATNHGSRNLEGFFRAQKEAELQ